MAGEGSLRWAVGQTRRLAPLLTPAPPAGPGVCLWCHGRTRPDYPLCYPCGRVRLQLSAPCGRVVPISLYRARSGLHSVLRLYKGGPDPARRRHFAGLVAGLVGHFLWEHGRCLAPGGWDLVTVVPSTSGRPGPHPLAAALARVDWLAPQLAAALAPGPGAAGHGLAADDAFVAARDVAGARVLLVDDTYTTGARAQSAASALAAAGAEVAAVVVAGRVVTPEAAPTVARWWDGHDRRGGSGRCCLEPPGAVVPPAAARAVAAA